MNPSKKSIILGTTALSLGAAAITLFIIKKKQQNPDYIKKQLENLINKYLL